MRFSLLLIPTLREDPAEAETVSHRLMLRAGLIRKVAAGIYTYLPLGLRVIRKVEAIIREEMNKAGAQELLMPIASPSELWRETGRWDFYGKELIRFKDRHERDRLKFSRLRPVPSSSYKRHYFIQVVSWRVGARYRSTWPG